jgi:hypothetical protein
VELLLLELDKEDDIRVELRRDVREELLLLDLDEEEDDIGAEFGRNVGAELLL